MSRARIFDAHVHVEKGLEGYDLEVTRKNVIFNDVASYRASGPQARDQGHAISLILDMGIEREFVVREAIEGRVDALKIHSRIQGIGEADWDAVATALAGVPARLPAIVDGFYFGGDLAHQPSLPGLVGLLRRFPERRFVVAHSGGYRILEYFFHLREFPNCYYELALSLQYLEDSSAIADLRKLVRHTDKAKILFGSDFPFGSPARQASTLRKICSELDLSDDDTDRIFFRNAADLFGEESKALA